MPQLLRSAPSNSLISELLFIRKLLILPLEGTCMSVQKTVTAYCVKCREKREMKDPEVVTLKNGKPACKGICPTCGTKMFRIGKVEI